MLATPRTARCGAPFHGKLVVRRRLLFGDLHLADIGAFNRRYADLQRGGVPAGFDFFKLSQPGIDCARRAGSCSRSQSCCRLVGRRAA